MSGAEHGDPGDPFIGPGPLAEALQVRTIGRVRKLLVFLAVLILLVVAVDIGGRAVAESRAGEAIGRRTRSTAPSVVIHGFSFLVQALPGRYSNITLTTTDLTAGPVTGIDATVELYGVDFPLADAVRGDTGKLTATQADLRGVIADSAINAAIAAADTTISAGADGAIRISGTVSVAGHQIQVSADLVASFRAGVLHLDATGLSAAGFPVPDAARLTSSLSLALPLSGLPFTVQAATLTAAGSNLILTATANQVSLGAAT